MDFISQFNQALAQYFTTHANLNFADQSGQSQNLNTLESKAFWMALGDIVELDGCPELSEGIRNGVCMVSCKDGDHSPHCSLHSFNSFRPLASTIPVMMPEKQSYYDQACQEMKDHLDLDFSDDSNLD